MSGFISAPVSPAPLISTWTDNHGLENSSELELGPFDPGNYIAHNMWGWSVGPEDTTVDPDFFSVGVPMLEESTRFELAEALGEAYREACEERGLTPRDAYFLEVVEETTEAVSVIGDGIPDNTILQVWTVHLGT